ncbi:MAG TPA: hypothetical protein VM939_09425, partial [Gemmatimonadaceae bacterium]|nr:hypothetical protein [Gemmatimonadaceae bacterium]
MTNYFFALEARGTRLKFARRWGRVMMALSVAGTIGLTACEEALEVTDPDVIDQGNVTSPEAAEGLRVGAFARLANMTSGGESTLHFPGLLVDEWRSGDTFVQRDETDKRTLKEEVTVVSGMWYDVNRARTAANQAIVALNEFPPVATASLPQNQSSIGQMFWLRGFAETAIAENYCNGTPISAFDLKGSVITYGNPESNVQVYNRAIASFDSGAAAAGATLRGDTVRILARIGKARVLMNLGRFNDAATVLSAAPAIPSEFRFRNFHQEAVTGTATNQIWALNNSGRRYVVGDRDGGVGLNFA